MKLNAVGNFIGSQKDSTRAMNCFTRGKNILETKEFEEWFLKQTFTQLSGEFKGASNTTLLAALSKPCKFTYQVIKRSFWKRWSSAIGYTVGSTITTYKNNFDSMNDAELTGHIIHELTHVLDQSHAFNYSKERDSSVPYKIGSYIISVFK